MLLLLLSLTSLYVPNQWFSIGNPSRINGLSCHIPSAEISFYRMMSDVGNVGNISPYAQLLSLRCQNKLSGPSTPRSRYILALSR